MAMRVVKVLAAGQAYGRGGDNYRMPAKYAVRNERGATVGIILGARVGFMQRGSWDLCWLSPEGVPRHVRGFAGFKEAKAWAETWDGQAPERWRVGGGV